MKYSVNSYFQQRRYEGGVRIEVYPNNKVAEELIDSYRAKGFRVLRAVNSLEENYVFTSTIVTHVFECIDEELMDSDGGVLVVGLDSLLAFRPDGERDILSNILKKRIEQNEKKNVAFLIHSSNFKSSEFQNTKYRTTGKVVFFEGEEVDYERPTIDIVSPKWLSEKALINSERQTATSLDDLFEKLGDVCPTGRFVLLLEPGKGKLNDRVRYRKDAAEVAEIFYKFKPDLPKELVRELLEESVKERMQPEEYLTFHIGETNFSEHFAATRLRFFKENKFWDAFVWVVRRRVPLAGTYLGRVLDMGVDAHNFERKYIVDGVISLLKDDEDALHVNPADPAEQTKRLEALADERRNVIRGWHNNDAYEPLLSNLVDLTRGSERALLFLNCETAAEEVEIIRRVKASGLLNGMLDKHKGMFFWLDAYLTQDWAYPDAELDDYFREYRRFKVCDDVSEEFVRRAYDGAASIVNYQPRLMALAEYDSKIEKGLATIVVDAMGAEYLPLLLATAKSQGMVVTDYRVVSVNLPTSTEFNQTPQKYNPTDLKELDNIVHNGAVKNETSAPEANLWASLKVFGDVFKKIQSALLHNEIVIVTADHGSTRLAKIAYDKGSGLVRAIDSQSDSKTDDWRFQQQSPSASVPEDVMKETDHETNTTYWVVKGYNRFSKSGGKKNEMHGGATLEEALVPFVVFARDARDVPNLLIREPLSWKAPKPEPEKDRQETKPDLTTQMVEDSSFDI